MLLDPRPYFADMTDIEDWVNMELFAEEKEEWFRQFLELPNGIPSHNTLSDVIGRLPPGAFTEAFLHWAQSALPSLAGKQVCLDGKTLRGSRMNGKAVHLLSAYAAQARLVLAQAEVDGKSNEITAIPALLSSLDLTGAVVTIEAMGCQKAIADKLVAAKADYVLALKDNHLQLYDDVSLWLNTEADQGRLPIHETVDKDHGRLEIRRYTLSRDIAWLE